MRTDAESLLHDLAEGDRLVHLEHLPARPARTGSLSSPLPDTVWKALDIPALWSHQAAAIDLARQGRSVVLATGTASGKSLCYQAAIAEAALDEPAGSALLLFPTKALAQDQLRALTALAVPGVVAATYDGDTSPEARTWVRRHANVVLTNPEMLHGALLPFHGRWADVPPAAALRGGRRAARAAGHLRLPRRPPAAPPAAAVRRATASSPTFVFSSATIGEPARLASELCGLPVEAVTDDGSPRGERLFALWNPPLLDDGDRDAGVGQRRGGQADGGARGGRLAHRDVLPQPPGHRAGGRRGPPPGADRAGRRRSARTGPATSPPSGGRSRPSCSPGASRASWPPAPSSWASTSAASTPACSTASPARSPRCGSRPGGPAGARTRRWRCWWPAPTSSTSG